MSKLRKKTVDKRQMSIFDFLKELSESQPQQPTEGQFRIIDPLKVSLRSAIKACPLSRHQIGGEMSHLLGETITKEKIDSWTRESDEMNGRPGRHIPAEYLPAFCHVTDCNEPIMIMGRMSGVFMLPGPEALRAEIQKLEEEIQRAKSRKKKRMIFLKEMEGQNNETG